MSAPEVDVAAHRDSYPMGNIHHGTPENPDWGTFCVECTQSWPCDVSILAAEVSELRATVARVEALVRQAEYRTTSSLSRDFTGRPFESPVPLADLRAALAALTTTTQEDPR
jgi:hypothetical protein